MNEPLDIPTFETTSGHSWIDLTLSNNILPHKIRVWTCGEEESCADHKIILFDIEAIQVGCNAKHYSGKRYFTGTEDWGPFVDKLATNLLANFNCRDCPNDLTKCDEELSNNVKQCSDTGETMHKFLSAVTAACDTAFKASRPGKRANKKRSVPWWSSELTILRKKVLALRRRYQRTRNNENLRRERRLLYQEGNRLYQSKIREEKLKSWKEFYPEPRTLTPVLLFIDMQPGNYIARPLCQL